MGTLTGKSVSDFEDRDGNIITGRTSVSTSTRVDFNSTGGSVVLGARARLHGHVIFKGPDSTVVLEEGAYFRGRIWLGSSCTVRLGRGMYCGADLQISTAEGQDVVIGDDCLVAARCRIRADDSHPIYDAATGSRINLSRTVKIGDHVWIGTEVMVMPGSRIGSGSVVGARSMVTASHPVPENAIVAGTPAVVIREGVHWTRKHLQTSVLTADIEPGFWDD